MTHGAACPIRFPLRSHGTPIWRPSVRSFSSGWEGGLHWWTAKLGVAGCSGWGPSIKDFGNIRFTIYIYIIHNIYIYIYIILYNVCIYVLYTPQPLGFAVGKQRIYSCSRILMCSVPWSCITRCSFMHFMPLSPQNLVGFVSRSRSVMTLHD